jgi:hypothetical protein
LESPGPIKTSRALLSIGSHRNPGAKRGIVIASTVAVSNSEGKVSRAVQRCIARCYGKTPIGVIAEFLAELRQQGWTELEIHQVETAARRVLAGIIDPRYLANPFDDPTAEVVV